MLQWYVTSLFNSKCLLRNFESPKWFYWGQKRFIENYPNRRGWYPHVTLGAEPEVQAQGFQGGVSEFCALTGFEPCSIAV